MAEYGINGTTLNLQHIVLKAKNASEWADTDLLLAGELGIELDTKKYKLGDGTTTWKDLGYYNNPTTNKLVEDLTTRVQTAEGTLSSHGTRLDALDGADGEIAGLKAKDTAHETRMSTIESKDSAQDSRLDALDGTNGEIAGLKAKDNAQDGRLDALEGITTLSANPFRE